MAEGEDWSWGRAAGSAELSHVDEARAEFRSMWGAMKKPPFQALFDGSYVDIRALDYMDYEGFPLPKCGLEGAAIVCGEVLRRAAGMVWVIGHDGDWFIAPEPSRGPEVVICPLSRLRELHLASIPQFGKHTVWLMRAVLDCLWAVGDDRAACELLDRDEEYLDGVERALASIRRMGRADHGA